MTSDLRGRELTVSAVGMDPYIIYTNPITGCDVDVVDLLSKRFSFTYKFILEPSFDIKDLGDGKKAGVIHSVSLKAIDFTD